MSNTGSIQHFAARNEATSTNVNISASGDNVIIAGVAGQTIRVVKLALTAATSDAVTLEIKDGASLVKGTFFLGQAVLDMETNPLVLGVGNSFILNLSSAVQVVGMCWSVTD